MCAIKRGRCKKRLFHFSAMAVVVGLFLGIAAQGAQEAGVYYRASTDKKVVALTFDDGPHPYYTDHMLSRLVITFLPRSKDGFRGRKSFQCVRLLLT